MYDYESDWTMGGEWWMRRRKLPVCEQDGLDDVPSTNSDEIQGVVKARFSTSAVSDVSVRIHLKLTSNSSLYDRMFHSYGKVEFETLWSVWE